MLVTDETDEAVLEAVSMMARIAAARVYCGNVTAFRRDAVSQFTCVGCKQTVYAVCNPAGVALCAFCLHLGVEKSREIQALIQPAEVQNER